MRQVSDSRTDSLFYKITFCGVLLSGAIAVGYLTAYVGELVPLLTIFISVAVVFLTVLFRRPITGLFFLLGYGFTLFFFSRELGLNIQWGIGQELLLLLTWIATVFYRDKNEWTVLSSDIVWLTVAWFGLSVLQIANPSGVSVMGWLNEIRTTALVPLLTIPLTMLLFRSQKHLNTFLKIGIIFSLLATLNGIKQLYFTLSPGEMEFLTENARTHMIFGQLRVFSFFSDAGQFGASQAHFVLICFILAIGPFAYWKRALLVIAGVVLFYGMMISGTRGAFFVLSGVLVGLLLTKNFKILAVGLVMLLCLIMFLKYTSFGQGNYHVRRLRTALNPTEDASFQVRMNSQLALRDYLQDKPFGGGLGSIGANGKIYNPGTFLANVEPDSYWVKVWAMYGLVGLTLWFCMMLYIIGKCCGIIWNIRDPILKIKLIALVSGALGVFISSYGNEVINRVPASLVVLMSCAIVYIAPRWDMKPDETGSITSVIKQ